MRFRDAPSVRASYLGLVAGCLVAVTAAVVVGSSPPAALVLVPLCAYALVQVATSVVVIDEDSRVVTIVRGLRREVVAFEDVVEVGFPAWGAVSIVVAEPRRRWWGGRVGRLAVGMTGTRANHRRVKQMAAAIGVPVVSPWPKARWSPGQPTDVSGHH